MLLLPHHPEYYDVLHHLPPPGYTYNGRCLRNTALVTDAETGLYREVNVKELFDYCLGGEYDLMMQRFGAEAGDEQFV